MLLGHRDEGFVNKREYYHQLDHHVKQHHILNGIHVFSLFTQPLS